MFSRALFSVAIIGLSFSAAEASTYTADFNIPLNAYGTSSNPAASTLNYPVKPGYSATTSNGVLTFSKEATNTPGRVNLAVHIPYTGTGDFIAKTTVDYGQLTTGMFAEMSITFAKGGSVQLNAYNEIFDTIEGHFHNFNSGKDTNMHAIWNADTNITFEVIRKGATVTELYAPAGSNDFTVISTQSSADLLGDARFYLSFVNSSGISGAASVYYSNLSVSSVPIPGAAVLFGSAIAGLYAHNLRRRRKVN